MGLAPRLEGRQHLFAHRGLLIEDERGQGCGFEILPTRLGQCGLLGRQCGRHVDGAGPGVDRDLAHCGAGHPAFLCGVEQPGHRRGRARLMEHVEESCSREPVRRRHRRVQPAAQRQRAHRGRPGRRGGQEGVRVDLLELGVQRNVGPGALKGRRPTGEAGDRAEPGRTCGGGRVAGDGDGQVGAGWEPQFVPDAVGSDGEKEDAVEHLVPVDHQFAAEEQRGAHDGRQRLDRGRRPLRQPQVSLADGVQIGHHDARLHVVACRGVVDGRHADIMACGRSRTPPRAAPAASGLVLGRAHGVDFLHSGSSRYAGAVPVLTFSCLCA